MRPRGRAYECYRLCTRGQQYRKGAPKPSIACTACKHATLTNASHAQLTDTGFDESNIACRECKNESIQAPLEPPRSVITARPSG